MLADCFADCGQVPQVRFIFLYCHDVQEKDYSGWTTDNFNQTVIKVDFNDCEDIKKSDPEQQHRK